MLKAPAQISKIKTLADRTIQLVVNLDRELPAEEMVELFKLNQLLGWFLFAENDITEKDLPKTKVDISNTKTPSQRLRAVIYRYWEGQTDQSQDFQLFYESEVEKIINLYKEKLN